MIDVDGGRVWYRIAGEHAHGIPVILLHGGPGGSHDYFEPLEVLADERPVIFYDQLGCGNSDHPVDLSYRSVEHYVQELAEIRAALGLESVNLLGQSWGSMLAVEYMVRKKPLGVKSLILSGPFLDADRWCADQRSYVAALPEKTRDIILRAETTGDYTAEPYQEAMMEYYRIHVCRSDPWPACLQRAFAKVSLDVYLFMWGPSEFTATGTLRSANVTPSLNLLDLPVLYTCGRYDEATPATSAYYRDLTPGADLVVFEDASHEHHLEQQVLYQRTVRDFLRQAES